MATFVTEQPQNNTAEKTKNTTYFAVDNTDALNVPNDSYDFIWRNEKVPNAELGVAGDCVIDTAGGAPGDYCSFAFSGEVTRNSEVSLGVTVLDGNAPWNTGIHHKFTSNMSPEAAARALASRFNRLSPVLYAYAIEREVRIIHTDYAGGAASATDVTYVHFGA